MMSKGAHQSARQASLENLESVRLQAGTFLALLDESELLDAAALMSSTIDAIDAHIRHLPANRTSEIKLQD